MILLKGFFRKISTKLYLIIFSILLVSIITLFGFVNYYSGLLNNVFEKSTRILMISNSDYYDKLNKYKNVTKIEKSLLFKPDYNYKVLGRQGYQTWQNGDLLDSREPEQEIRLNWDDFITPYLNYIMVFKDQKMTDNQIAFGFTPVVHYNKPIESIYGEKIGFNVNNKKYEFVIDSVYTAPFPEMVVSEKMFDKLYDNSNLYGYRVTINNYEQADKIMKQLERLENNSDFKITSNNIDYSLLNKSGEASMDSLKGIVQVLNIVSFIAIFAFSLIFIVVIKNIVKDENKTINIERLLGFNKKQIREYLFLKVVVLNIGTFISSGIISIIITTWINNQFNFNLEIFNQYLLLTYGSVLFVSLLFCLLSGVRANKYIRNSN